MDRPEDAAAQRAERGAATVARGTTDSRRSAHVRLRAPHARLRHRDERRASRAASSTRMRSASWRVTYRFVEVGGTSAGAIAAAAAAAAEHGREQVGFASSPRSRPGSETATTSSGCSSHSREPPYFRLLRRRRGPHGHFGGCRSPGSARRFPVDGDRGRRSRVALPCSRVWAGQARSRSAQASPGVFSPCSGSHSRSARARLRASARGRRNGSRPLHRSMPPGGTPGTDAVARRPARRPRGKDDGAPLPSATSRRRASAEVMTTNVTHRRPQRMPWTHHSSCSTPPSCACSSPSGSSRGWRRIPRRSPRDERRAPPAHLERSRRFSPLPEPDDLPVVVAARMSLSFPLLISAVPLHALDMTSAIDPSRARGRRRGRRTPPIASSPPSAGSPTAASRATSPSTSSTRRSRRGRPSPSTSTASTPTTRDGPTR